MNRRALALWGGVALAIAIVIPLTSMDRSSAATALPSGNENTSIIVQNVGNAAATFVADYYNPNGTLVAASQTQENVPPGGTRTFAQALNQGLPTGYRGLAVINSTQPINTLLVRDILNAQGLKSYSIANAYSSGGKKLAIPIAFNELLDGGSWNSRISVVNTGTIIACIRVTYYLTPGAGGATGNNPATVVDSPVGQPGCTNGYALAAGGQITFGRAGTGVTQFPAGTFNNQMAALIEVLNNGDNGVTANVDIYRSDGNRLLGSYNAFIINEAAPATDDVGTDVVIPIAMKHHTGFYTVIGILNVGGAATNVTIRYQGVDTANNDAPVDVTVNLNNVSGVAFNSTYEANADGIPPGFVGYARVTTSGQPVAAVVIRGKQTTYRSGVTEDLYTAVNGVPVDRADTAWNLPLIFRRISASIPNFFGFNSWIQVQVADGSTAQVTLTFVGDAASASAEGCNASAGQWQGVHQVTGSKVFYMNLNSGADNGFGGVTPACFWGGAQVTANKPIIVIANVTSDLFAGSDNDGIYNGFPQE
jgi:hypothetical protein